MAGFAVLFPGCGKKGPPLPPLVRLPVAPSEIVVQRHGATVDIDLRVPAANTDGTRPANIERVDVYGVTGPNSLTDEQLLKLGTKVASIPVKAPRDPNHTNEPDEAEEVEMIGSGLDQGAFAHAVEYLTPDVEAPVDASRTTKPQKKKRPTEENTEGPLLPAPPAVPSRIYVGVGVSTRGRNGPVSPRATIAMIPPPPAPAEPAVTYDEKAATVVWAPLQMPNTAPPAGSDAVLPSTPTGVVVPEVAYNVYEVADTTPPTLTRLTTTPVTEARFEDPRITWGGHRCYAIRTLVSVEGAKLESEDSAPKCVTFVDTFPPAPPKGVQAVPSEGAISLIWDANTEKDIRGYIVLRGLASTGTLQPIMLQPIQETSFQDRVQPGLRFVYAVQAVDTAGNVSPMSVKVEETAR